MSGDIKFSPTIAECRNIKNKRKGCDSIRTEIALSEINKVNRCLLDKVLPVKNICNLPKINKIFNDDFGDWGVYRNMIGGFDTLIITNVTVRILKTLESFSRKIVYYVMEHIDFNTNRIEIDTATFCENEHMDRRNFYRGLAELDNKQVLYRTVKQGIYSVNPSLIFRGSRVKFVQLYQLKYQGKEAELDSKGRIIISD